MADLRISDAKHIEQITGNEKIPVSADGEAGYIETGDIMVDTTNFLTSKQAAQKYYPKMDGEDLKTDVDEHDRAIGVIELQIGNLSFRAISKEDFGKLTAKEPNTLYFVTK